MTTDATLEETLHISQRSFERIAQFVTSELGIKMPTSKVAMIQSRLLRRVRGLGLRSIDEYCDRLFSSVDGDTERVHLINAITTNKTDFFREPAHFRFLTETALPEIERAAGGLPAPVAVWSAACSSGEEPYTLAMVLSEYAGARPGFDFQILATDISTKVLDAAKDGIYTKLQIEPVPRELRHKYLLRAKDRRQTLVRMVPSLRRRVSFGRLNFMDTEYGVAGMFDVIFCRNVLIYFDHPTQEAVLGRLCRKLKPGGYLFVSHSESISGFDLPLDTLGNSCFRKQRQ